MAELCDRRVQFVLIAPGDTLAVNLSTTPGDPRQLALRPDVLRCARSAPTALRVGASGLYSEVWPGDCRRPVSRQHQDRSVRAARQHRRRCRSQRSTLTLTVATGFSATSPSSDMFGPIYNDRIRTVSLNADYRLQDNFGGTNYLTVNWRQGLDILGASHKTTISCRVTARPPKFSALNFWFTRYQTITDAWSLKLASAGQLASGPLFLSQQFYLGGVAFGRGYGAAEISGDNGIAGSLELRFDQKLSYQISDRLSALRLRRQRPRLERRLSSRRRHRADLGRRRRAVLPRRRSAGRPRRRRAARLSRAGQSGRAIRASCSRCRTRCGFAPSARRRAACSNCSTRQQGRGRGPMSPRPCSVDERFTSDAPTPTPTPTPPGPTPMPTLGPLL